ncbi:MAG: ABC transporter permease [Anaerolineales bacterium]|nr:ABC transporter permease [Anaerolineales bacterium]
MSNAISQSSTAKKAGQITDSNQQILSTVQRSQLEIIWHQFKKHKFALAGGIFLIVMMLIAALTNIIMPYDPIQIDLTAARGIPVGPSSLHWFGTDEFGRDIFSRAISGARISLSVGFVAVGVSLLIGIVMGSNSGYFGGKADNLIMRVTDIFLSLPTFFLILTVNAYLKPNIYNIMIVIGIFSWMGVARLVRGEFLRLKNQEFFASAQVIGVPPLRIVLRHLLPNAIAPVIVAATLSIPGAILTESALSYMGLGVPPPAASWGSMLNESKRWMEDAWWMWVPPGILISLTVLSFNFVGDGLRDALDPTQRRS